MMKQMEDYVRSEDQEPEIIYGYYATGSKCSKTFGKNQIVLFAMVVE